MRLSLTNLYEDTHLTLDMFAIRTPSKRPTVGDKTPPSKPGEKSVRLSIGEWEAASTSTTPTLTQAGPAKKQSQTQKPEQRNKASDKTFVKTPTSPKRCWPTGRVAEARACLNKGKLNLENSRNLKTEIKIGVSEALDRLYALVKEAELEIKKIRSAGEIKEPTGSPAQPNQTAEAVPASKPPSLEQNKVTQILEEHSKLLLENNKRLQEIQGQIENQKEQIERVTTATYADIAARKTPSRSTLHSVVVTSKDETETGEEVLNKVRQAVDAKQGWVRVEKIRKARDRKVIMGFSTKEERDKVKTRLERDSANLTVEDMRNKDPLLVLRGVLTINSDEDIVGALRNQNREVFRDLDDEQGRIEVKYRRKARNPHTSHVIIATSPTVWQRALHVGSLHIDLQRVKVEDQSPLVQCTRCLGYGHGRRLCRETVDLCSHCGGPHLRAECPDFLTAEPTQHN